MTVSRINCNVAGDLIPLYVDEVLSADSAELVEEHLVECEACTAKVEALRGETLITAEQSAKPLEKIKGKMKKDKWLAALMAAAVVVGIGFWTAFFCDLVASDISYDSVKDRIVVLSGSDLDQAGERKEGHDALILFNGKPDYHSNAFCKVVGEKDGVQQVEVTVYMSRAWSDMSDYLDSVRRIYQQHLDLNHIGQPYSIPQQLSLARAEVNEMNGWQALYEVHSVDEPYPDFDGSYGEECRYYKDRFDYHSGYAAMYFVGVGPHDAYGNEVVAVYYGKFETTNNYTDIKIHGKRNLLWAKEGYDAH